MKARHLRERKLGHPSGSLLSFQLLFCKEFKPQSLCEIIVDCFQVRVGGDVEVEVTGYASFRLLDLVIRERVNDRRRTIKVGVPFGNLGSLEVFNWVCLDRNFWMRRDEVRSGGRVIELSHECHVHGNSTAPSLQPCSCSASSQLTALFLPCTLLLIFNNTSNFPFPQSASSLDRPLSKFLEVLTASPLLTLAWLSSGFLISFSRDGQI